MQLSKEAAGSSFSRGLQHAKANSRSTNSIHSRCNTISLRNSLGKHSNEESDSEETSGSEDDSGSEEESSSSEDSDEEMVDCKVTIGHSDEVRGFSVSTSRGFTSIMKQLEDSYGSPPRLSYFDDEGDKISILASSDFEYAVRAHKTMTSLERKSKKLGANKLTFVAEFGDLRQKISMSKTTNSLASTMSALQKPSTDSSRLVRTYSCVDMPSTAPSVKARKELNEVLWQRGELLGSGSFGQVYSGIDMSTGVRIAVKEVMLGTGKKHEQQALALLREIKILSELDHPNIIKYLGTEYSENTMRIFLELATEGSLKDALTAFGSYFSFCSIDLFSSNNLTLDY
jgi:Protein kinase domain/PB1 domain